MMRPSELWSELWEQRKGPGLCGDDGSSPQVQDGQRGVRAGEGRSGQRARGAQLSNLHRHTGGGPFNEPGQKTLWVEEATPDTLRFQPSRVLRSHLCSSW